MNWREEFVLFFCPPPSKPEETCHGWKSLVKELRRAVGWEDTLPGDIFQDSGLSRS